MDWDPFMSSKRAAQMKIKYNRNLSSKTLKVPKLKLLARLLKKAVNRAIGQHFQHLKQSTTKPVLIQERMCKLINRNLNACKILAWQKIKQNVEIERHRERYLKNLATLAHRFYLQKWLTVFQKVHSYGERRKNREILNIVDSRGKIFMNVIKRMLKSRKQLAFKKLNKNRRRYRKMAKKLNSMAAIRQRLQKNSKRKSFNKIMRIAFEQDARQLSSETKQDQFTLQLNDMTIQLQNKKESIDRLTSELRNIRLQVSEENQNRHNISAISHRSADRCSQRSAASNDSHDISRRDSFDNKSHRSRDYSVISQDYNIGSILGSSFMSFASRGQRSGMDSINADCNCHFRYKYYEYKSLHETSKNQLDILKKELEVAKDLNEHFENELKFYGEVQEEEEVEQLKLEVKDATKDRDSLREKVYKYQKYIASLKVQLKQRMEELYRKIKREC